MVKNWEKIELLFQLTKTEINTGTDYNASLNKQIFESYLFFAIELKVSYYSRTELAQITREINKLFLMPVMIIFKQGDYLSLSIVNRRLNRKAPEKDVLEKVTLIKDITIQSPHRGHIEILFELSFQELYRKFEFKSFVELHNSWQEVFDSSVLNKKFYKGKKILPWCIRCGTSSSKH